MKDAGYNPNEAIKFWQNMMAMDGRKSVPEFLSTHPADQNRIDNIKKIIAKM